MHIIAWLMTNAYNILPPFIYDAFMSSYKSASGYCFTRVANGVQKNFEIGAYGNSIVIYPEPSQNSE